MKIGIIGSRTWEDEKPVLELLALLLKDKGNIIHTGDCPKGVDSMVGRFDVVVHKADWGIFKNSAGVLRNIELVQAIDICFIFRLNQSKGSTNVIDLCKKYKKPYFVMDR